MALGLALTGLTDKSNGEKLWTLDTISWWDELELIKDPRFKKLDLGPDKLVHEAVLPVEKTLELNNKYKKNFLQVFDDIVKHCRKTDEDGYTPSDFSEADINQDDLDNILSSFDDGDDED